MLDCSVGYSIYAWCDGKDMRDVSSSMHRFKVLKRTDKRWPSGTDQLVINSKMNTQTYASACKVQFISAVIL
jgi:hypothetical protein